MAINDKLLAETKQTFTSRKILTIEQVAGLLQCTIITARRFLKASRALTSYNQKGRYYTLTGIPRFDRNGLWRYRDVFFTKHGNLRNTIVYLVANSSVGLSAGEIGEIVGLDPTSFMHHFRNEKGITREKHDGRFIYFSDNPEICSAQIIKRISVREQMISFPSDADALLILVQCIKHPNINIEDLAKKVLKAGKHINVAVIRRFLEFHDLLKKTPGSPL